MTLGAALALAVPTASAADYVGTATCKLCHKQHFQKLTNSIHSYMIRRVDPAGTLTSSPAGMPAGVENIHGNLAAPKAPPLSEVTYVMGGWYKEESYIKEGVDTNGVRTFTVNKYQYDPIKGTYVDNQSLRDWLAKCAGCHTTGYNPTTRGFNEVNIGCEACHGPGSEHVDGGGDKQKIVIDRSNEGCGHCHIRAESAATDAFPAKTFNFPIGYELGKPETLKFIPEALTNAASFFPDGTSKRHRQQFLDMHYPGVRTTKHYESGVSCTDCHDPHTSGTVTKHTNGLPAGVYGIKVYNNAFDAVAWDGQGLRQPREQVCTTCHTAQPKNHMHYFTPAAANATVECVDCHMPDVINVDPVTLRGALHPHTFNSMRPETTLRFGAAQENSCTYRCHQNKGADKPARAAWARDYLSARLALLAAAGQPIQLRLTGLTNFNYAVEGSADLRAWTPLTTNKAPAGILTYDVPAGAPYQFYRTVEK